MARVKHKPRLRAKHAVVGSIGAMLFSSFWCFAASFSKVEEVGIRTRKLATPEGGQVVQQYLERYRIPNPNQKFFIVGAALCLVSAGTLSIVTFDDEGEKYSVLTSDSLGDDFAETVETLSHNFSFLVGELAKLGAHKAFLTGEKTLNLVYLKLTPPQLRNAIEEKLNDLTWIEQILKKSIFLVAKTRDGKTTILKFLILKFIEAGKGTFLICDINYGKPNEEGEINDWMQMPIGFIKSEFDEVFAAIESYQQELEYRRKTYKAYAQAKAQNASEKELATLKARLHEEPFLLILEEWIATANEAERRGTLDKVISQVEDGLVMGLGYRMPIIVVAQTLAVGETHITLAMRDQLAIIVLENQAQKIKELNALGCEDAKATKEQVTALRRKGKRVAVVGMGVSDPAVRIVPNLSSLKNVRIAQADPNQQWWQKTYTRENQEWLRQKAIAVAKGERGASPISSKNSDELKARFGIKPDNSEPKYTKYLRPEWERLLKQAKEGN